MAPRRSNRPPKISTRSQEAQDDSSTSRSRTRGGTAAASSRHSPYPSSSRQTAPASQAQAEVKTEAQTQDEAQAQLHIVNVQPPTAQSTIVGPLPTHEAPPASYLNLPPQLTPNQQRFAHLEHQVEALQHSLNSQMALRLQQPHYALSASLPYAPVAPPSQGPFELPRQSFLNTHGESQIFESIFMRFPYIKRILVEDIWHNRLSLEGFSELAYDPLPHLDTGELPKVREMFRGLEVYSQIVCSFASKEVALDLFNAFSTYRLHLISLLGTYTFESTQVFHHTFVRIRLRLKQDDPVGWATRSELIERAYLIARAVPRRKNV